METNKEEISLPRKTLSSSSVNNTIKKPKGSDGINVYKLLFFVCLFIIAIAVIFNLFKEDTPEPIIVINHGKERNSTPIKTQTDTKKSFLTKKVGRPNNQKNRISVSASDIDGLRRNLLNASTSALMSGNYTPINLRVNLKTFSASFELDPIPSNIIKLSLLWGPINVGCESCLNSLQKNPGSLQIYSTQDNTFEYGVIAIAN